MAFWSWVQSEDTEEISGILSKTTKEDKIPDETKKDILWFYKNSVEIETLYTFYNRIKEQLENSNFPFKEYITVPEIILKMVKRKEIMLAFSKSYFVIILKNKEEGSNLEDNVEEISYVEKGREEKIKHRKITLSLPEDVVKLLWVMKAERGYSSISQIVAEAVREFSKKQE